MTPANPPTTKLPTTQEDHDDENTSSWPPLRIVSIILLAMLILGGAGYTLLIWGPVKKTVSKTVKHEVSENDSKMVKGDYEADSIPRILGTNEVKGIFLTELDKYNRETLYPALTRFQSNITVLVDKINREGDTTIAGMKTEIVNLKKSVSTIGLVASNNTDSIVATRSNIFGSLDAFRDLLNHGLARVNTLETNLVLAGDSITNALRQSQEAKSEAAAASAKAQSAGKLIPVSASKTISLSTKTKGGTNISIGSMVIKISALAPAGSEVTYGGQAVSVANKVESLLDSLLKESLFDEDKPHRKILTVFVKYLKGEVDENHVASIVRETISGFRPEKVNDALIGAGMVGKDYDVVVTLPKQTQAPPAKLVEKKIRSAFN